MKKSHGHTQCGLVLFLLLHSFLAPTSLAKKTQISGPVKTVVVLVMENRSFDHMLGWLKTLNPEIDGLTGTECNHLNTTITNSPLVCVSDIAEFVDPDPGHSFQAIREQIFGQNDTSQRPVPMNGFAQQAESMSEGFSKTVMSGFRYARNNMVSFNMQIVQFVIAALLCSKNKGACDNLLVFVDEALAL